MDKLALPEPEKTCGCGAPPARPEFTIGALDEWVDAEIDRMYDAGVLDRADAFKMFGDRHPPLWWASGECKDLRWGKWLHETYYARYRAGYTCLPCLRGIVWGEHYRRRHGMVPPWVVRRAWCEMKGLPPYPEDADLLADWDAGLASGTTAARRLHAQRRTVEEPVYVQEGML